MKMNTLFISSGSTKKSFRFLLILMLLTTYSAVVAQEMTVTGTVISAEDGQTVPGASVLVKGTSRGTVTNSDGKYLIKAEKGAVLRFTFIGMEDIEIQVSSNAHNIILKPSVVGLDEVVAVGYATMKKRELTGAIVSVKSEDIAKTATSDFASAIQGQMAGVSVRQGNAAPGENSQIIIRGITSFQEEGSSPLYVVDGVTYESNPNITPQEIESIEVLKDGASAAIYGARASGGVILITTRKGREGQMQVSFDSYFGIQKITSSIPLAGTLDALYINDILNRYLQTNKYDPLQFNPDGLKYDTNWIRDLQVDNAPLQSYTLGVSGGNKGLTYNVTGTLFDQAGTMVKSDYKKYSLRSNTFFRKGRLVVQTTLSANMSNQIRTPYGLMYEAIRQQPYRRPVNFNDNEFIFDGSSVEQISQFIGRLKEDQTSLVSSFSGNIQFKYELMKGLELNANLGQTFLNQQSRFFKPSYEAYNTEGELNLAASNTNAQLRLTNTTNLRTLGEFMLNYRKSIAKTHSFHLLLGNTFEKTSYEEYFTGAQYISSNLTPVLGNGEPIVGSQFINNSSMISYIGRLNYSYKSKYMVNGVVRVDGSSRFGENNAFGAFPSIALAWSFSEESFMSNFRKLSLGKIRFGYGTTGSDRIPPYSNTAVIISNVDYPLGGGSMLGKGMTQPGFADPNIKWESNISKNLGLDLQFNQGKSGLTIELYEQDKRDMLLAFMTPVSAGSTPVAGKTYDTFLTNIGNLRNRGIELSTFFNHQLGPVQFKLSGTFTKNENKVIRLSQEGEVIFGGNPNIMRQGQTQPVVVLEQGLPVGAFKVYETKGTIKTDEQLSEYKKAVPTAQLGDLIYAYTVAEDGTVTLNEKVYKGTYQPDFEYGININAAYSNFDGSIQFFGVQGNTIYNGPKQYAYSVKRHRDLVYAWTHANPGSNVPTPRTETEHNNTQTHVDYFLEDGSFLRVRNIILGYSLKENILSKLNIEKLRFYINAQNPFIWTKYTGYDPEVGSDNVFNGGLDMGNHPVSSSLIAGVSVSF
ncbi:MAG: SusC/RagA family TonB-linked outer membrane protein [Paludibacter sp.]|jgi:TonB-linked SusC/RagA family outer membrane protein|nr:SusC/RagA family TonB-linked outer membrane protein [Paludibacter sp.]